jgi:hypothetical protein
MSPVAIIQISEFLEFSDRFPRPRWDEIAQAIEASPQSERRDLWSSACESWLAELGSVLGQDYELHVSTNFILLTHQKVEDSRLLLQTLESARKRMLCDLTGIASDGGNGKNVILIFDSIDDYYDYISYFYPETGEFALSSGVFLSKDTTTSPFSSAN